MKSKPLSKTQWWFIPAKLRQHKGGVLRVTPSGFGLSQCSAEFSTSVNSSGGLLAEEESISTVHLFAEKPCHSWLLPLLLFRNPKCVTKSIRELLSL